MYPQIQSAIEMIILLTTVVLNEVQDMQVQL